MSIRRNSRDLILPALVGTVHSQESLRAARRLPAGAVDCLELRVDHFAADPDAFFAAAEALPGPRIVTVRDPREGGQNALPRARRAALCIQFLPLAAAVDLELRNARALASLCTEIRSAGAQLILSCHDFQATPSAARLAATVARAIDAGADIVKIAARADQPAALHRLLGLLAGRTARPLSVMAMGRLGKVSRLLFAQAGSVLTYAYLGAPNASGQWSARDFRARLAELEA